VRFLTSATALSIEPDAEQPSVVFEHDQVEHTVDAEHVLVNAGPRTFARLMKQEWNPVPGDEGSVVKINMLLRRLPEVRAQGIRPEDAFAGSFHIDEGYRQMQESWATAVHGRVPDPVPGEIYCHSLTDGSILSPELREKGFHTLTLFGLDMPYRLFAGDDHDTRRDLVRERFLDGIDRVCAEPFRDCLAIDRDGNPCLEIRTPRDLEQELDLDLGNIFHNELTWFFADDESAVGRWGVETAWPRILMAGSSAHRGGAVSGIPGRCAAMCVLERQGVAVA
jgi:phytoene dehydrogenase-like protein